MPPTEFYIRLQHGITGGFAPPTPSAIHQISRSNDFPSQLVIASLLRPEGTNFLCEAPSKKISVDPHAALLEELHSILKEIPTESPPGIQDIYGFDTSISWGSDDLTWSNRGPAGCGVGTSERQASDEDKKKFKRAVEIVNELANQEPTME